MTIKLIENPFLELVQSRRSVRVFTDQPVEREKIFTCLEAARLAPSAENVQPWRFIVLDDPSKISEFSQAAFSGIYRFTRWAARAPVIVALCAEKDWLVNRVGKQIQGTHYYLIDIGIAGEHVVLQARQLDLGTCWIGWFDAGRAARVLKIPRAWKVVSLLAMGYPGKLKKEKSPKKKLAEIVYFNGYKKES